MDLVAKAISAADYSGLELSFCEATVSGLFAFHRKVSDVAVHASTDENP